MCFYEDFENFFVIATVQNSCGHLILPSRGEFDAFNESAEYKSKGNDINHLKLIHKTNLNKLVVAYLNVNSIRNKFETLIQNVSEEVDLLIISEIKLDESLRKSQILTKDFSDSFRIDRNVHGRGILLYIRED